MRPNDGGSARGARAINPLQGAPGQATLWTRSFRTPARPPLRHDVRADVCIVGAGIAGLSVGYQLARNGASVAVLEDGAIGSGMTSRTTGHLASAIDDRFHEIERMHGTDVLRLAAQSHAAAIDEIERIVVSEGIACDFARLPGYLMLPPGGRVEQLDRELDAARRAGVKDVERVERPPLPKFDGGPSLRFERQGVFHPLKYIAGLVEAIERNHGAVYPATRVTGWSAGPPFEVRTLTGPVLRADAVVFATNVPINDRVVVHSKQAPYLTHVIVAKVTEGAVTPALYWVLADPYHYVRLAPAWREEDRGHEFLIVGGEDYRTGRPAPGDPISAYSRLEQWARERFDGLREVVFQWSGQVMEPADGLAFIGRNPADDDGVYVVTGDSGMGLTHGTLAGLLIRDLVMRRENPWAAIYDPGRLATSAPLTYAKSNLEVAGSFLGYLTGGEVASTDEIQPDSGAVVRRGLTKVAAYRDLSGRLHEMSATCPHLKCLVAWNHAERTWDCPCHGSRFDAIGKPISGPANVPLAPVEKDRKAAPRTAGGAHSGRK